jgi:nucleotide-binding universal stress UspA family protein
MPSTVVVPLDGSQFAERALRPAAEVARLSGARVVVVTARYGGVVAEPHHYLEEAARAAGIPDPEPIVVDDRLAASAIVAMVEENPDPVVCLATHARGRAGEGVFGSVAEETLRRVRVPVVLVGPAVPPGPTPLEELVVCLDGSKLGSAIAPVAAAWARDMHLDVILLGVVDAQQHQQASPGSETLSAAHLERVARELEEPSVRVRTHLLHSSHSAGAIVEFAGKRPRAFLALSTHGRTGLERLTTGSVTMAAVRRASCPALTLRPSGLAG